MKLSFQQTWKKRVEQMIRIANLSQMITREPTDATTTTAPSTELHGMQTTTGAKCRAKTDATTTTEPSVEPSTDAPTTGA